MTRHAGRQAAGPGLSGGGRHARRVPDAAEAAGPATAVPGGLGAADQAASAAVRPYFFTRGRTRAAVELAVEALVSAVPGADVASGPAQTAFELCRGPCSVAEVAARMRVPLGVARVLLGDLLAAGALTLHRTADVEGPDLTLLRRVRTGLHNL